jgi:NADH:ubiquinone oxidoreductase subunit D
VTVGVLVPERRPTEAAGLVPKRAAAGQQRALNAGEVEVLKKIALGELVADMVVLIGSLDPVFGEVHR